MSSILSTIVRVKLVKIFDVMECFQQEVECAFPGLCGFEWVLTIVPLKVAGKCRCVFHRGCRWCYSHKYCLGSDGIKSRWYTLASSGHWEENYIWRSVWQVLPSLCILLSWMLLKNQQVLSQARVFCLLRSQIVITHCWLKFLIIMTDGGV